MGKIIRNGIPYSGSYDNATSVNYDNSVSGLDARTVQEGIDELSKGSKGAFPVDNLLSTATDIPLSANQGRVLDEKIGALSDSLEKIGNAELLLKTTLPTEFTTYNFLKNTDNYRFLYVGAYWDNGNISIARLYVVGLEPSSTILYLNELPTSAYTYIEAIGKDNIRVRATDTHVGIVVYGIK